MCLVPEENQQPVLGRSPFSQRKVALFIGRETTTRILHTKIDEHFLLRSASSGSNYSLRISNHPTTTTTTRFRQVSVTLSCVSSWSSPVVDMMLHGDRRQRRLRSWWRHEQQSVAVALSAAGAAHYAPRKQTQRAARGPVCLRKSPGSCTISCPEFVDINTLSEGSRQPQPQQQPPQQQQQQQHINNNTQQQQQQKYNLVRLRFNRRGACTPLWGVEACSPPSRRPNPIPALPPYVVRTPHLHGGPTTEETVKL